LPHFFIFKALKFPYISISDFDSTGSALNIF